MNRFKGDDRGIAAIWMAITFLFNFGAAAIAVDASGAYNTARTDQTTADLA
jgi:Flp pilus assembly protein TadG